MHEQGTDGRGLATVPAPRWATARVDVEMYGRFELPDAIATCLTWALDLTSLNNPCSEARLVLEGRRRLPGWWDAVDDDLTYISGSANGKRYVLARIVWGRGPIDVERIVGDGSIEVQPLKVVEFVLWLRRFCILMETWSSLDAYVIWLETSLEDPDYDEPLPAGRFLPTVEYCMTNTHRCVAERLWATRGV